MQKNQHIHVAIKLQHIMETDDNFRKVTGLPRLDLPEHLWGVRDMWSAHTREQDFMAITAEVEVLCQLLKGRGMYTFNQSIRPRSHQSRPWTSHYSSLNLLDDSPRMQSSSNDGPTSHGQVTPRIPAHGGSCPVPPTPYINQTAMDQHKRAQPAPLPPRTSLGMIDVQTPKQVQSPQLPDSVQPQRLPFIDAPRALAKNHQSDNTSSPSTLEMTSKSLNR